MTFHVKPVYGRYHNKWSRLICYSTAAFVLVLAVVHLFRFEELVLLFTLHGGEFGIVLAACIVACEVFALPVLLGMYLSPLMKYVSALCGALVILLWTIKVITIGQVDDTGLLGSIIHVNAGESFVALSMIGILLVVSFWRLHVAASNTTQSP